MVGKTTTWYFLQREMADKRDTLEELARREADALKEREETRVRARLSAERLAREVPERFFTLARELREAVHRFNGAADPQLRLSWRESAALAARDPNLNADFNLSFGRTGVEVVVSLNAMSRSGRPDAYLIEASAKLRDDSFLLRGEGFVDGKEVGYRISIDFKRMPWPIDELADRLVKAVVKNDRAPLAP